VKGNIIHFSHQHKGQSPVPLLSLTSTLLHNWSSYVVSWTFIEFPLPNKLAQTGTFLTSIRNLAGSNFDHPEVRRGFPLSIKQTLG